MRRLSKISLTLQALLGSEILEPALEDVVCDNPTKGAGSDGYCLRPRPTALREQHPPAHPDHQLGKKKKKKLG